MKTINSNYKKSLNFLNIINKKIKEFFIESSILVKKLEIKRY